MEAVNVEEQGLSLGNIRENMKVKDRFIFFKLTIQLFALQKVSCSVKVNEVNIGAFDCLEALDMMVVYQVAEGLCHCSY